MKPEQSTALARLLKQSRTALGLSAREVAKRCGITDSNVVRLEQDAIANPRPDTLKSLADVLRLDLANVYAATGYVQPASLPSFTPLPAQQVRRSAGGRPRRTGAVLRPHCRQVRL